MRFVLLKSTRVRGVMTNAGEEFDCPEKEGKLWCALGWARERYEEEETRRPRGRPKGSYSRRDMRAED